MNLNLFIPPRPVDMSPHQVKVRDRLNRNLELKLETVPCLCGSSKFSVLSSRDRYGIDQQTAICEHCGLIQLNPRMTADAYREFYASDDYRVLYEGEGYLAYCRTRFTSNTGRRILSAVRAAGPFRSVVEIGCGGGWNLVAFRDAGFDVAGWDYSESLTAMGREHGMQIGHGGIDEALATGRAYDVVVLNHVLEHFLDPVSELRKLRGLLNERGRLYVCVPTTDYPWSALLQNAHTYYFTDRTLAHYLAVAGWRCGGISRDTQHGMYAIATPGTSTPISLTGEYIESIRRLETNRWKVPFVYALENFKGATIRNLHRLRLFAAARAIYRLVRE